MRGAEASCSLHSPRPQGTEELSKGLMQGTQCPGAFPLCSVSQNMLWSVAVGSPESVRSWPGLAGAEGMNRVRGSSHSGIVTGTGPHRTMNTRLENLELILWHWGAIACL